MIIRMIIKITKMIIRIKRTYIPSTSTPVTVFLITEKLLSLWHWNFQTFSSINVLWKIKQNCVSELFCIANLFEVDRKIFLFNSIDINPLQIKMEYNISIINFLIEMTLKLAKSQKAKNSSSLSRKKYDRNNGTAIVHFWDKQIKEYISKVIQIVYHVVIKDKYCQICSCLF